MKLAFFSIPTQSSASASEELNHFLASHAILSMERQFIQDGQNSLWAICVSYQDSSTEAAVGVGGKASKVDYKEVLDETEFLVYAKLRDLRKQLAEQEGVPAYALFNNKQLAEMVQSRVTTKTALQAIPGVGETRADKYGEVFLQILNANHAQLAAKSEAS